MGNNRRREPAPTAITPTFRARAVAAMVTPYAPDPDVYDHRGHGDRHRRRGLTGVGISTVSSVATRFI